MARRFRGTFGKKKKLSTVNRAEILFHVEKEKKKNNNIINAAGASMKIFGRFSDEQADRNRTKTNGYVRRRRRRRAHFATVRRRRLPHH